MRYPRSLSVQFSSVAQLCLTLCDPMNCNTPGLPVYHQLKAFSSTQKPDAIVIIVKPHPKAWSAFPSYQIWRQEAGPVGEVPARTFLTGVKPRQTSQINEPLFSPIPVALLIVDCPFHMGHWGRKAKVMLNPKPVPWSLLVGYASWTLYPVASLTDLQVNFVWCMREMWVGCV